MDLIQLPEIPGRAFARSIGGRFAAATNVIEIYDEIGVYGVSAQSVSAALRDMAGEITVKINSPGGDVFDGIAIYNNLVSHPASINIQVDGIAASAASLIAMAGDTISMAENSFLMVHNAWSFSIGDKRAHRKMGDVLEGIDGALANTYAARSGMGKDEVVALMDDETWLTAQAATESGFANEITEAVKVEAAFDLSMFSKVPAQLKRQMEGYLRDAGFSRSVAAAAVANGFSALPRDAAKPGRRDADAVALWQSLAETISKFKEFHDEH